MRRLFQGPRALVQAQFPVHRPRMAAAIPRQSVSDAIRKVKNVLPIINCFDMVSLRRARTAIKRPSNGLTKTPGPRNVFSIM